MTMKMRANGSRRLPGVTANPGEDSLEKCLANKIKKRGFAPLFLFERENGWSGLLCLYLWSIILTRLVILVHWNNGKPYSNTVLLWIPLNLFFPGCPPGLITNH